MGHTSLLLGYVYVIHNNHPRYMYSIKFGQDLKNVGQLFWDIFTESSPIGKNFFFLERAFMGIV